MKKYILILILFLVLSSCSTEKQIDIKKYYSTGTVFEGNIINNNNYIGYIESQNSVELGTELSGKVSNIYFGIGDLIKKGDLIVKLDSLEQKSGFDTSSEIFTSLLLLKKTTSLMFDSQIKSMEEKIKQAKILKISVFEGLDDTKEINSTQLISLELLIKQSKLGLETEKLNYQHTKTILDTKLENIYSNSKNAIVSSVILDTNILNFIDNLLGVRPSNRQKNDGFESYLSVKNIGYLKDAKNKFLEVDILFKEYKDFYDSKIENKEPSTIDIEKGLKLGVSLAENLKSLLDNTYNVLDNTIDSPNLDLSTLDLYKNRVSIFGTNIESSLITVSGEYILGLNGSKQNLENFNNEYSKQLDLLEKKVNIAEKILSLSKINYNKYKIISNSEVRDISDKTRVVSSQLEELKLRLVSLKQQKKVKMGELNIQISKAKGNKDLSLAILNKLEIIAPFGGIITNKNIELGQVISAGFPMFSLSDESRLLVRIGISDNSLSEINIGGDIMVEVEGITNYITGTIQKIFPSKDLLSKNNIVEVSIKKNDEKVKIGSYAKLIFKNSATVGKIIPNKAIISKFLIPGVYVLNKGIVKFKSINIISYDEAFSQIEGLKLGETIIIDGKENIWDGEVLK